MRTRKVISILFVAAIMSGCASTVQRDGAITLITDAKGWDAMNRGHIGIITETKHTGTAPSSFWENQNFWTNVLNQEVENGTK